MGLTIIVNELGVDAELLVHVGSFLFGDYRRYSLDNVRV